MTETIVSVRVQTKARERRLTVLADGTLKIATPVAPEQGRANDDVIEILAGHFRTAKSNIELIGGQTSRNKKFRVLS